MNPFFPPAFVVIHSHFFMTTSNTNSVFRQLGPCTKVGYSPNDGDMESSLSFEWTYLYPHFGELPLLEAYIGSDADSVDYLPLRHNEFMCVGTWL